MFFSENDVFVFSENVVRLITENDVYLISGYNGAKDIYYNEYFLPLHPEKFNNDNLLLQIFDVSVNSGQHEAIVLLQKILGVTQDGNFGIKSFEALNLFKGDLVSEYKNQREIFYKGIVAKDSTQAGNLQGWLNRIKNTHFV